jgi:hypothetical protein
MNRKTLHKKLKIEQHDSNNKIKDMFSSRVSSLYATNVLFGFITLKILVGFPIFRFWAFLMKVIPETRRAH